MYVCVFVLVRECRQYVQWRPEIEETKEEEEDDENEKIEEETAAADG